VTAGAAAGSEAASSSWSLALQSLKRPYPMSLTVAVLMAAMISIVPFYILIAELMPGRPLHAPALPLDRALPLQPAWALVYGALYLFLILLPLFVVRQEEQIRRTLLAYLAVWVTAYACFLAYPTVAPRPAGVVGSGVVVWGLRFLYAADPPFNCFPSLHVAHSFVSALTCHLVNRGLGVAAVACASLVGAATLLTKQHYLVDVLAGVLLAGLAWLVFLRGYAREAVPPAERRAAPALAAGVVAVLALAAACFWVAYRFGAGV